MANVGRPKKGEEKNIIDNLIKEIKLTCSELKESGVDLCNLKFRERHKPVGTDKDWAKKYDEARFRLKRSGADLGKIKLVCHGIDRVG